MSDNENRESYNQEKVLKNDSRLLETTDLSDMINVINNYHIDLNDKFHKALVKRFLKEVEKGGKTDVIDGDDVGWSNRAAFQKVLKLVKEINHKNDMESKFSGYTEEEIKLLNEYLKELENIKSITQEQIGGLKGEIFDDKKTKETITRGTSSFIGIEGSTTTRLQEVENLGVESKTSLGNILKSNKLSNIAQELKSKAPKNEDFVFFAGISNYEEVTKILKDNGYITDGLALDQDEAQAVYSTIIDYAKNQLKVKKLNSDDKLALLLDFDKNGTLEINKNFNVGEAQSYFIATKGLTSGGIDTFMSNLGLGNMSEFTKNMSNNLYSAREEFQKKLGTMIERGIKPGELVVNNGVKKALDKSYKEQEKQTEKISKSIENDSILQKKFQELKEKGVGNEELNSIKETIKLEAVGALIGSSNGIGATFNVKQFTRAYVDSLQIGIINGVPGIAFTKNLFEQKLKDTGLNISFSIANFVIPILGASYKKGGLKVTGGVSPVGAAAGISYTYEGKNDIKELFPENIDGTYEPSVYVGISTIGHAIGISVEKVDLNRQKGIEKAVDGMKKNLEIIKKDLREGKDFNNSEYEKKSDNKESDEKVYNELKDVYNTFKSENYADKALNDMMSGYLNYYRNTLYKNAQNGIKLDSIGGGVALLAGYLPIPFLTITGEKIKQNWKAVNHGNERERENTRETVDNISFDTGLQNDIYNKKQVYSVPDTYNISIPDGKIIQAEKKDGKIYFYTDKIIEISEHTTNKGYAMVVVIDGGNVNNEGVYKPIKENEFQKITGTLDKIKGSNEVVKTTSFETQDLKGIKNILNEIGEKIDIRDLKKGNGKELQKSIHEMLINGEFNQTTWDKFIKFNKKGTINLGDVSKFSDEQKMIILERVFGGFMISQNILQKRGGKVGNNKTAEWVEGMNMKKFDNSLGRKELFNSIIKKDWGLDTNAIDPIRNNLLDRFKDQTKFDKKTYGDMTSFVVSNLGVTPMVGEIEVAKPKTGDAFETINNQNLKDKMIDSLPKTFIKNIQDFVKNSTNQDIDKNNIKTMLKGTEIGGLILTFDTVMFKWGDCFNDAFGIRNLKLQTTIPGASPLNIKISSSNQVYAAKNDVKKFGLAVIGNKEKEKPKETPPPPGTLPENSNEDTTPPTPPPSPGTLPENSGEDTTSPSQLD